MSREYRPHLDDDMRRILGNREYEENRDANAYWDTKQRYERAVHSAQAPQERVNLLEDVTRRYKAKHNLELNDHDIEKIRRKAAKLSGRGVNPEIVGRQFPLMSRADAQALAETAGSGTSARGFDMPADLPSGKLQAKLGSLKAQAESGDKVSARKFHAYANLWRSKLLKPDISPATRGGALGALSAILAPLVIKGVKALASKLKPQGGYLRSGVYMLGSKGLPGEVKHAPRHGYNFWKLVFKQAQKDIPMYFKDSETANQLAEYFVNKHAQHLFGEVKDLVLAKALPKAQGPLTVGDIMTPILAASAKESGLSIKELAPLLNTPEAQQPAGAGIMSELLSLLSSPAVKELAGSVARTVIPKAKSRIKMFAGKHLAKQPKIARMVSSGLDAAESAAMTALSPKISTALQDTAAARPIKAPSTSSSESSTTSELTDLNFAPSGSGPGTGDSYTRGGAMYSSRVYDLAKKASSL